MADDQENTISLFLDIAEGQTPVTARGFLEAAGWNIEDALQLYFSVNANGGADLPNHRSSSSVGEQQHVEENDDEDGGDEEEEDDEDGGDDGSIDYEYLEDDRSPSSPSGDDRRENNVGRDLDSVFSPPFDLMFLGPFVRAKHAAKLQNRWLLVNLQAAGEFSSYTLNRDTWKDNAVAEIIKNNFIFWQEDNLSEEGSKVCSFYKLAVLPAILVIEPFTGLKLRGLTGMVQPENLLENIFNCLDSSPKDYISNLSHKNSSSSNLQVQDHGDEGQKQALPLSLEGLKLENDEADGAVPFPPLPEEPKVEDAKLICRVGIRFPDGRRIQRRFLRSDPIQLLWSFCCSELQEADQKQPFRITLVGSGCSKLLDYSSNLNFKESDLENRMLWITWD